MVDFTKIHSVHFIGIGGIGTSAIARMFLRQARDGSLSVKVSGSDRGRSEITDALEKEGARISISEDYATHIPEDADLIIYSAALEVAEPDFLNKLKAIGIPAISYSGAIGEISKNKRTIAVSGTHGKTTVSAMVATILTDAGLSPTAIIGSILTREKSNFVQGRSDLFVIEADEYRRSFLSLSPEILVINNIDRDHLDYFKDTDDIISAYAELARKVPKNGAVVADLRNEYVAKAVARASCQVLDYATIGGEGLSLKFPGAHNIANAKAALTVAGILGVSKETAMKSLNNFQGTWRRFEHLGETASGALVFDDYAHNPQKIRALLKGTREKFPDRRIMLIFQPHLYSRTKTLLPEFAQSFQDADIVLLAPIFPAREAPDSSVSHEILGREIEKNGKTVRTFGNFAAIANFVKEIEGGNDVILTVGAGDIYKVAGMLLGQ